MLDKIKGSLLAAYRKIGESLLMKYAWPDSRSAYNAWFMPNWDTYATGYKEAADAIMERIIANPAWIDTYLYPVMFLYRHYLELRMKEIIKKCGCKVKPGHSLESLLPEMLEALLPEIKERRCGAEDQATLQSFMERIAEFHRMDQTSETFRYPDSGPKNEPPPRGEWINLLQVQQVVDAMSMYLDGISSEIEAEIDAKRLV